MKIRSGTLRSNCPINFGVEIFGDKWTLLVLRDLLLQGKRTFTEFQASEERISTNILSDRLDRLTRAGLVSLERVTTDGRQRRYVPTSAGKALLPVLVEMAYWGARQDADTSAPAAFIDAYETDRDGLIAVIAGGADPTQG